MCVRQSEKLVPKVIRRFNNNVIAFGSECISVVNK